MAHYYGKHDGVTFFTVYHDICNTKLCEFTHEFMFHPDLPENAPQNTSTFTIYGMPVGQNTYKAVATYVRVRLDDGTFRFELWRQYDNDVRTPMVIN